LLVAHVLGMALGDYRRFEMPPASLSLLRVAPAGARLLALSWRTDPFGMATA
jgi:hypothetical protein